MIKEAYETAKLEIIRFDAEDVIATSGFDTPPQPFEKEE